MQRIKKWLRNWLGIVTSLPAAAPPAEAKAMKIDPTALAALTHSASNQYLAQLGSHVVMAREVEPYKAPPGVVPDVARQQADAALNPLNESYLAMDNAQNAPSYTWLNQQHCGLGFPGYAYLSELSQRSEYREPAQVISKEMTRKFIKFTTKGLGDKAEKITQLEAAFKKFDVRQVCRKAIEIDLFFGRAQIFIDIAGQESDAARAKPLIISKETIGKDSLNGFRVIEPIWTTPYTYNSIDPTRDDFYRPQSWYVLGRQVHASRLMMLISRPMPDMLKPAYNFGGISLTQLMEPYVLRWLQTVDSVNRLINNFSIIFLRTDMQAILSGDAAAGLGLMDRIKMFIATRGNLGVMALNKDSEELGQVAVGLAGLDKLQAQAQEHMAAPTHIPLVKLTGVSPSGLNASSEGEIQVFYDFIDAERQLVLEPIVDYMLDIVQLNEFGEIDDDIDYEFIPLVELTPKEKADIRKSDADLGAALLDRSVITPDEERERLMRDPNSGYQNLTGSAPEPPDPDPEGEGETPSVDE